MRTIDLICPGCGAHMKIDRENQRLLCTYCGRKMVVSDESLLDREANDRKTEEETGLQQEQEKEPERLHASEENERKARREMLRKAREENKNHEDIYYLVTGSVLIFLILGVMFLCYLAR